MLAVLVDAVNIIHSCRGNGSVRKRGLYNEAHEWIFTRGSGKTFSFENVCDGLGIEPEMLRRRLSETNDRHGLFSPPAERIGTHAQRDRQSRAPSPAPSAPRESAPRAPG